MKRTRWIAALIGVAGLIGACGATYDRDDAIADLVAEGIDETTAVCIVDGIEENFSIERLEGTGDLSDEEQTVLGEITTECLFAELDG